MNFKKIYSYFVFLFAILLINPAIVYAGGDSGLYIGAGYGDATVKDKGSDPVAGNYDFNENDTGYKIFTGYNFGAVPGIDLAVEVSYVDFGNPKTTFNGSNPINFELTGYNAFGIVGLSFGPLGIFAKAGAISWDSKSLIANTSKSESGTDAAYGIGVRIQFVSIALRAEYEVYEVSSVNDLDMLSFSLAYTF